MKSLGISVYPEHTTKDAAYAYMRRAGELGFKRVFTCFLSVTESKEDLVRNFSEFCQVAHEAGLTVSADTNPEVFKHIGATPYDLSIFHGAEGAMNRHRRMVIHEVLLTIGTIAGSLVGGFVYQYFSFFSLVLVIAATAFVSLIAEGVLFGKTLGKS